MRFQAEVSVTLQDFIRALGPRACRKAPVGTMRVKWRLRLNVTEGQMACSREEKRLFLYKKRCGRAWRTVSLAFTDSTVMSTLENWESTLSFLLSLSLVFLCRHVLFRLLYTDERPILDSLHHFTLLIMSLAGA